MIRLEPFSEAHLDGVAGLVADPDTLRFTRVPEPTPPGYEREWLARYEQGRIDGTHEGFAAVDEEGTFLGLGLVMFEPGDAQAELGYVVAPEARGRGVATEILRQLADWAFTQGLERVHLIIEVGNPASSTVAERAGFVREGVMRSLHMKNGRRADAELWSRLPSDTGPRG